MSDSSISDLPSAERPLSREFKYSYYCRNYFYFEVIYDIIGVFLSIYFLRSMTRRKLRLIKQEKESQPRDNQDYLDLLSA